jgi:hypothetical protein
MSPALGCMEVDGTGPGRVRPLQCSDPTKQSLAIVKKLEVPIYQTCCW